MTSHMIAHTVFQFQNGTIKRKILRGLSYVIKEFQFQNGTIKSP